MLQMGKLAGTRLMELDTTRSPVSEPGRVYHLHIETNGIVDERKAVDALVTELRERFNAKVLWIGITGKNIDMQLIGSPFVWAVLIAALPLILGAIGILVAVMAVYTVLASIPSWGWALIVIGIGLVIFAPKLGEFFSAGRERIRIVRR